MDQTKFINAYIANIAEQLKVTTLDNIMVKTQLSMANETIKELTTKVEELEDTLKNNEAARTASPKKSKTSEWKDSEYTESE